MKSIFILCEYGISINVVRYLDDNGITLEDLYKNINCVNKYLGENSEKKLKIKKVINRAMEDEKENSIYELINYGLSKNIIDKLFFNRIDLEDINEDTKEECHIGDNTYCKITNALKAFIEDKKINLGLTNAKVLKSISNGFGHRTFEIDELRYVIKQEGENTDNIDNIIQELVKNKKIYKSENKYKLLYSVYELEKYGLSRILIENILVARNISIEDIDDTLREKFHVTPAKCEKILDAYKKMIIDLDIKKDINKDIVYAVIKKSMNYKYATKEEIKDLLKEKRYNLDGFDDIFKELLNENKIIYGNEGYRATYPTFLEELEKIKKDEKKYDIVMKKLKGYTLEQIGTEYNVTRERIRQIIAKEMKKIHHFEEEEKYLNEFCQYNFDYEEFQLLFKINGLVYYYFKEKYNHGKLDIFEYIKNNDISKEIEDKIYKKYNTVFFMGERIKLTKLDIVNVYLKHLKNSTHIEQINEELNKIFVEYGLEEHNDRALESMVDRNNYAIGTINRKFRGYNLVNIDQRVIGKLEKIFDLKKGYYSTLMIYNVYKKFFEEIDIRDEYELHDLIRRKLHPSYDIKFERMPNFIIGNINKKQFFYNEMLKYSPINIEIFLNYMEKYYGHKKETLKAYIQKEFTYNINQNIITVGYSRLKEEKINILKKYITEEIYNKEEIFNIFNEVIGEDYERYFNKYNMDMLNYKIVNNYVLKNNQKSIEECIKNRIIKKDFYEIEDKFATSTYYLILSELESKLEIIRFNENSYITIKKLEEVGIKKEDIINYKKYVIDNIGERKFFTIPYIQNILKFNIFEEYGFENVFFESIIGSIDKIKKIRFSGTKVFCIRKDNFSKIDFISQVINDVGTIDIYKLKDLIKKEYGIVIEKEDLQQTINESNLYYDKIIEKVFRNKEEYYKEVYK